MSRVNKIAGALLLGLFVSSGAQAATLQKITLAHALPQLTPSYAIDSSMPVYLGYWKKEGLDVDVETTPGSSVAIQLVISGRADAAIASPVTAMAAIQKGVDLKIVYTTLRGDIFGVAFPTGGGIQTLKDLKGKIVGVSSFASSAANYTKSLLRAAGLADADFSVVEVGVGARAASALRSNQVQALGLWDVAFAQMEESGIHWDKVVQDPRASTSIAGSLIVRGEDIVKRPQMLIGLARAVAKAQLFQAVNPQASVLIHWKVYPQSVPRDGATSGELSKTAKVVDVRKQIQSQDAFKTGRYGDVHRADMEKFQTYLVDTQQLPAKIDVGKYYTNDLIKAMNDFDHAAVEKDATTIKVH